jgi:protein gp37
MNKTSIDWKDLGYSWNPVVGCANGCTYCYARKINNRFKMIPNFSKPQFFPNRIDEPTKVKKPATIFVGSMCDIFSPDVLYDWVEHILQTVHRAPQHTYYFLTKRPSFYNTHHFPNNCWLGTTIDAKSHTQRLLQMYDYQGNNKLFVSIEPIFSDFLNVDFAGIDLIIVGADTSMGAKPPKREWVDSIKHPNIWYKKNIIKHFPDLKNKS